jgi:hypothetical protein
MPQDLELDDDLLDADDDNVEAEEIPEVPAPPKKPAGRKKSAFPRAVAVKEFDIRAAHAAWKEKNGIEDDYPW